MNKDTVPENYTMGLALYDFVPVLFFGVACYLLWKMTGSVLVLLGGLVSFISGTLKVLWKIIVVVKKKNIWPLFVQMRIGLPAGLMLVLIGFVVACFTRNMQTFWNAALKPAPILFLLLYFAGTAAMVMCGRKLDSAEAKANWIEQSCNTVAQGAFLINMLLIYSKIR
ncbi:MAG: hypothetical protein Q4D71_04780 [Oscillospiraceae bacterium]|nr:hypothetical protein [Oscillospiraceae bacterium]